MAAARQEGKVVLGVPPGPQYQPAITSGFEKAYPGIAVEITNIHAAGFTARVAKERAAGVFAWDAWIGGPDVDVYQLANDGVFDPFKPEIVLPEALDDSKWMEGFDAGFSDKGKKFTYDLGANGGGRIFANRDFVPESALATWEDLWKPEFKGKIVWQDPRQSGSGVSTASIMLKLYGEQKLRDLWSQQQVTISTDERQMADWLARGTQPLGVGLVRNRGIDLLQQQGVGRNIQPVASPVVTNSPGAHAVVAINRPPHPNARKVMLNWLLTQDGQRILADAAKVNSRRLDVPIVDPSTAVPKDAKTFNPQAEEFAPLRQQANKIAQEIFK
ncbi:MAG TPA: extracellular solute-binding protein [Chloroflexota bacterium]|nr:extracellular solute-binding protein [Chloroflexota bacterium]